MATTTPRIGLTKPDGTDLVDIAVLNTNFDKIDSNIASTKIQSTKPTTANAGDLWWDSDTGTLYLYYTDANSSQWVAATSDPINIGVVASQAERDAQYPTPAQGMSVYRTDLGYRQNYYGLYNVSTNPGGKTPAGWYREAGQVLQTVFSSTTTTVTSSTLTPVSTTLTATITPTSAASKIVLFASVNGIYKNTNAEANLKMYKDGSNLYLIDGDAAFTTYSGSNFIGGVSTSYVEASGSTTARTFTVMLNNDGTGTVGVQSANCTSSMIIFEVSA